MTRHSLITERRLHEAMDKLQHHHESIADRLRTKWRREDEAWARGEELPPEVEYYEAVEPAPEPVPPRMGMWERLFKGYW